MEYWIDHAADARPFFPPNVVIQIKALACELPFEKNVPLPRFSMNEIVTEAVNRGIVTTISDSTIWRWLHEDAIKPWQYRNWIFPRDPQSKNLA